jgi:hypothetical protein
MGRHGLWSIMLVIAEFASIANDAQVIVQVPENVETANSAHNVLVAYTAFQILNFTIGRVEHFAACTMLILW